MTRVFEMEKGEIAVVAGDRQAIIVRLDDTLPPEQTDDLRRLSDAYQGELDQTLAQALFDAFVYDSQIRAQPQVDQNALNAVAASFQ
jgi:peptidyl-prolyl cis-trans isomerase D